MIYQVVFFNWRVAPTVELCNYAYPFTIEKIPYIPRYPRPKK